MTYPRVIPRDLFNEAKLLKCLGRIYICAERTTTPITIDFVTRGSDGFGVDQDESDGSFYALNVEVTVNGRVVMPRIPLNSREDWPLYVRFEDDEIKVFDATGNFTDEFLEIGEDN